MAGEAALGRGNTLNTLQYLNERAVELKKKWAQHLETTIAYDAEDEQKLPVTMATPLAEALTTISNQAAVYNSRIAALQDQGLIFEQDMSFNLPVVLRGYVDKIKGPETVTNCIKSALPDVEEAVSELQGTVGELEAAYDERLDLVLQPLAQGVQNEQDERIKTYKIRAKEADEIREALFEELNVDAVWLREKQNYLARLESWLAKQSVLTKMVACHEKLIMQVLKRTAKLGLKVRGQRLMTEYFKPA